METLNPEDKTKLVLEASEIYEQRGMSGFQAWAKQRGETDVQRNYLKSLSSLLEERNGCASSRVYSFTPSLVKKALELS